jgi:uncharacterized double-CXXCG motif protein
MTNHRESDAPVFYRLNFDRRDWYKYRIDGGHQYAIPPFMCDGCGGPTTYTGESYPGVDASRSARLSDLLARRAVCQPELDEIRALVRDQCPASARLTPGTGLGPFQGSLGGRPLDVCWHEPWTVFFRMEAVDALRTRGVVLPPMYPASLTPKPGKRKSEAVPLYQPQVGFGITLTADSFDPPVRPPCVVCGRSREAIREAMIVDAASYDPVCGDLMRARNAANRIIVTARFVAAAQAASLTGFVAAPIGSR